LIDHPITNSVNEQLAVVKLDGYIPTGIPNTFWEQFVSSIQPLPGVQQFNIPDPGNPGMHSPISLELVWKRPADTIGGTLDGINTYQNLGNRLSDILIIRVMEKQFVEFPEPEQHRGLRASPTNGESALAPVSAA